MLTSRMKLHFRDSRWQDGLADILKCEEGQILLGVDRQSQYVRYHWARIVVGLVEMSGPTTLL